jgi:hypothetical protein
MPSLGETLTVSGVVVGIGVAVASGVEVNGIDVAVDATTVAAAGVTVGKEGVTAFWQAARMKMERKKNVFFIVGY